MIGVLLVDDDPLVRGGLSLMLGGAPDVDVLGEPPTARRSPTPSPASRPTSS